MIGHATFCVVIVYNNVIARLRRTSGSFFEASADLGATGFQTFRFVTLPVIGTALIAGGLLAFALSWDEIVVTYFTAGAQNTLPLLIYGFIRQGQNLPIVNAIALVVILVTAVPVYIAQRLTSDVGGVTRSAVVIASPGPQVCAPRPRLGPQRSGHQVSRPYRPPPPLLTLSLPAHFLTLTRSDRRCEAPDTSGSGAAESTVGSSNRTR